MKVMHFSTKSGTKLYSDWAKSSMPGVLLPDFFLFFFSAFNRTRSSSFTRLFSCFSSSRDFFFVIFHDVASDLCDLLPTSVSVVMADEDLLLRMSPSCRATASFPFSSSSIPTIECKSIRQSARYFFELRHAVSENELRTRKTREERNSPRIKKNEIWSRTLIRSLEEDVSQSSHTDYQYYS